MVPVAMLALAACNDNALSRLDQVDVYFQEGSGAVDILFVVDDSISMANEQELVAQGFQGFISVLDDVDVDFHLAVTTTDMDDANPDAGRFVGDPPWLTREDDYYEAFLERVHVGTDGSDKERGLEAALAALTDPGLQRIQGDFLREEAALALVFVTDENDCSDRGGIQDDDPGEACYASDADLVSVREFTLEFLAIKGPQGRVTASGILGPEREMGCDGSWPGTRYMTVIDQLDGIQGNICDTDYRPILGEIGEQIVAPQTVFQLSEQPVEETIEVMVDDVAIPRDPQEGWTYDDELRTVNFQGSYVPPYGSVIEIRYEMTAGR